MATPAPRSMRVANPTVLVCKNCELRYKGYYCPRCGQSARTTRFTPQNFFREFLLSSLDIEKGFIASVKKLIKYPGKAIREYIQGRRASLYNSARFLVLVGTVATFISVRYDIFMVENQEESLDETISLLFGDNMANWYVENFIGFWEFANEYTTVINIISIPIFSLFTFLIFIRAKYNYIENFVLNVYIVCMQLLLLVVFMPFFEIFASQKEAIISIYTLVTMAYNIWCYMCFYDKKSPYGFFLSIATNGSAYILQFIVVHVLYYIGNVFVFSSKI